MKRNLFLVLSVTSLLSLSSCPNLLDPFDSPTSDPQLLAYARACFDKGDYACALAHYAKLANNEAARADEAFVILDQNNLGVGAFAKALNIAGGEAVGSILTELAESAAPGAGLAKRNSLVNAYKKVALISNTELKGFVRFTTAVAIAAELLAEESGVVADRVANKTDFTSDPSVCTVVLGCGGGNAACTVGSPTIAAGAGGDPYNLSGAPASADLNAAINWDMFVSAINAANTGLTEMQVSAGDSLTLINTIINTGGFSTANAGQCARSTLVIGLGFGRS